MRITLDVFKGEIPALAKNLLPIQNAQQVFNAKLTRGDLRAWNDLLLEESLDETSLQTILQYAENGNLNWVAFEEDVDYILSPLTGEQYERMYFTGLSEPRVFANDLVSGSFDQATDYYKLGVPEPEGKLDNILNPTSNCTDPEDDQNATTGWTAVDSSLASEAGGVAGYRLKVTTSAANGCARAASISVTAGNKYRFRARAGADSGDQYNIRLRYETQGQNEYLSGDIDGQGAGTWDEYDYEFTATYTDADFRIELRGTGNGDICYFDNVRLEEMDSDDSSPTIGSGYSTDSEYRAYVFRYVTRYGEMGPPSDVASISDYGSGTVPIEDVWGYMPEQREIERIYLYRTSSSSAGVATFRWVLEATFFDESTAYEVGDYVIYFCKLYKCTTIHPAGVWDASDFTAGDDVTDANLSIVTLEGENWDPPPAGLKGLIILPNGIAAGFYGNDVYLSEPYQIHAWPTDYIVSIPQTIIGLGSYGTNIVVVTNGNPYIISGQTPAQMSATKLKGKFPGLSKRSIVSSEFGVQYICREGMVRINENGLQIDTASFMNPADWVNFYPTTLAGIVYSGKYFGIYEDSSNIFHGFIIDYAKNDVTELDFELYCGYISEDDGELYFGVNDEYDESNPPPSKPLCIKKWEGDIYNYMYYRFTTKKFILPVEVNFACARLIFDQQFYDELVALIEAEDYLIDQNAAIFAGDILGAVNDNVVNELAINDDLLLSLSGVAINPEIVFKVYADGILKFTKNVSNNKVFKLGSGYKSKDYEFRLEGNIPIKRVDIANSVEEITQSGT